MSPQPAAVFAGRIVDVDPLRWTCVIRTEEGGADNSRTLYDVLLGGPYLHPLGEGILIMPDIGALVEVCCPAGGREPPFITAYRPYPNRAVSTSTNTNKPTAAGNRTRMAPGDMGIVGRDRNGMFVRRGQFTEIFGGPLARTMYLGRTGTVHTICQALKFDAFGGSVRWEVDRAEADPDGHQRTRTDLKIKEYADDRSYVVRAQLGGGIEASTEGESDGDTGAYGPAPDSTALVKEPVLRVRVYEDGDVAEDALSAALSACVDKTGQLDVAAKGAVRVEICGNGSVVLTLSPDGTVSLVADGDVSVESSTRVSSKVGALEVVHTQDQVTVGAGTAAPIYDLAFSADAAAAWTESASLAKALGVPCPNIDKHIASLAAAAYTAKKLMTE